MEPEDKLWQLLGKRESGDITPEELTELGQLLRHNEPVADASSALTEVLKNAMLTVADPPDATASWQSIAARIRQNGPAQVRRLSFTLRQLIAAASVIFLILTVGFYYYHGAAVPAQPTARAIFNQVSTPLGSKSKIILPDGTKVWLNAGSHISYNDFNNDQVREVTLSGEAFFDVVHSAAKPFVVHTSAIDIHDLGTVFAVKAYPDDKKIETTLIEGSIEVIDHYDTKRKVILKPSTMLTIFFADSLEHDKVNYAQVKPARASYKIDTVEKDEHGLLAETAWAQNKLVFNNEPFGLLAERLQRWYNVSFHFEDSLIKQTRFSGIIENETLEQSLQAMQFSTAFKYRLQGSNVWISKK